MRVRHIGLSDGTAPITAIFVVDTNIAVADPSLSGVSWMRLRLLASLGPVSVVVPEVVVLEVARQRHRDLKRHLSEGAKAWGQATGSLESAGVTLPADLPDVRTLRAHKLPPPAEIADRLRKHLDDLGATVHPIPSSLDHNTLVTWSLEEHPPFDATDKGYRDALIWATVREVAAAAPQACSVAFLSNDNDFCDGRSSILHPQLAANLSEVTANSVLIARTVGDAVLITGVAGIEDELVRPPWDAPDLNADLAASIRSLCDNLFGVDLHDGYRSVPFDVELPLPVDEPTVDDIDPDLDRLDIVIHEVFDGGTVIGDVSVPAGMRVTAYVLKAELAEIDTPWRVDDGDYNDHTALVSADLPVVLEFSFAADAGAVQIIELTSVQAEPA
ncbi:PIN domain-containing protein (plasmid) [Mycobacterium sp. C3-094]